MEEEAGQDDVETLIPFVVDSSLVVGAVVVEPFELAAGWSETGAVGRAAAGEGPVVETSSAGPGAAATAELAAAVAVQGGAAAVAVVQGGAAAAGTLAADAAETGRGCGPAAWATRVPRAWASCWPRVSGTATRSS